MEKLLQRSRSERTAHAKVDNPRREPPDCSAGDRTVSGDGKVFDERTAQTLPAAAPRANDPPPLQTLPDAAPLRRQAAEQIRADVDSLREVAKQSARAAVAHHTTRRLRRSFALNLPLTILAFSLAGALYVAGGGQRKFHVLALSTAALGAIGAIEVVRSWLKIKYAEAQCNSVTVRPEKPARDAISTNAENPTAEITAGRSQPKM